MSTPVSVQDSSPVSWTSWESRFLPMGACADGVFGVSLAGTSCWGGAGVSRTSCARRACGNATAESENPRVKASLNVRNRIMNTGHPAQGQEASSQLTDARGGTSVVLAERRSWCEEHFTAETAKPRTALLRRTGFLDGEC